MTNQLLEPGYETVEHSPITEIPSNTESLAIPEEEVLEPRPLSLSFTGNVGEYFKIWIVNVALTVCTLGLYSAWAKVRKKRYLYSNTILDGSPFEYHGDPMKIFKGRLVMVGVFLLYMGAVYFLPSMEMLAGVLFFLAFPWLVVKAQAFNARNSSYRNIRFDFKPEWKEAFKVFYGFGLVGATGLGYPYFDYQQAKFLINNFRYGTTSFALQGQNMISVFYAMYLAAFGIILGLVLVSAFFSGFLKASMDVFPLVPTVVSQGITMILVLLAGLLIFLAPRALLKAKLTNLIWSNCTVSNLRFRSFLKTSEMIWLYVSNALAIILSLGLLIPWATIRLLRYRLDHFEVSTTGDLDEFVSDQQEDVAAMGEEASEFFDMEVSV